MNVTIHYYLQFIIVVTFLISPFFFFIIIIYTLIFGFYFCFPYIETQDTEQPTQQNELPVDEKKEPQQPT